MSSPSVQSPAGGGSPPAAAHPAPERTHVSPFALWFGLFGAPFAWSVQLIANYIVASHACYPRLVPLTTSVIGERPLLWTLIIISVIATIVAIAALLVSIGTWRRTSGETGGGSHWLLDTGTGRTRFMGAAAIMTSSLFLLGILVHFAAVLSLGYCV